MRHHHRSSSGFTLIEVILAGVVAASIFAAIFTAFGNAIHLRRDVAERSRLTQLRARALDLLRDDLRHGYVSGGILAASLVGSKTAQNSKFPGYLRISTTTGQTSTGTGSTPSGSTTASQGSNHSALPAGDVQEVEYYIAADASGSSEAGTLVRITDQDLLSSIPQPNQQQNILTGVSSLEVNFWDGQNWTDTWDASNSGGGLGTASSTSSTSTSGTDTDTSTTVSLPQAIRVRITQVATPTGLQPKPLELLLPWSTQASISAAATTTSAATTTTP